MGKLDDVNWKKEYDDKLALMTERGFFSIDPIDFYRTLFPAGCLSNGTPGDGKGNAILTLIRSTSNQTAETKHQRTRQWIINDDLGMLQKMMDDPFALLPPLSYFGKTHSKENAHELYAFVIDIDYVGVQQLQNLLKQFQNGARLCPTYLVNSGKGVHLYYLLAQPIDMYAYREDMLSELKKEMIRWLWNDATSLCPDTPDITGVYQGFRAVGSLSKFGTGYPVVAYCLSENRYSVFDLKDAMPYCEVDLSGFDKWDYPADRTPLDQAKELWPEWYEKRIVQGLPAERTEIGSDEHCWTCKTALYQWWQRKIYTEAKVGGRYYSILALCAYGLKCGIPDKQIKKDAFSFLAYLESLTVTEDNHFLRSDVNDALKSLRGDRRRLTRIATRAWIEEHTKINIPANKRNGFDQKTHLEYARGIRALRQARGEKVSGGGRPSARKQVESWRRTHPSGTKSACKADTGLSYPTIRKWWDVVNDANDKFVMREGHIVANVPLDVLNQDDRAESST